MGYIKIEDFSKKTEWVKEYVSQAYELSTVDWYEYTQGEKPETLRIDFFGGLDLETYFEKTYSNSKHFKVKDALDSWVEFPELSLSLRTIFGRNQQFAYTIPDRFHITMSLWDNTSKLIEWFIPLHGGNEFQIYRFDLTPLIEKDVRSFNKIRFNILQAPFGLNIIFGDLYLFQDDIEHNLKVSIAKMLHLKHRKFIGLTTEHIQKDSPTISLSNYADIFKGTPIMLGDSDSIHELHIVGNDPYEHNSIVFSGEFSGKTTASTWAAGTPIHIAVPALFGDLSQSEEVFPTFYISTGIAEQDEDWSINTTRYDSYIRDTLEQKHKVATRKSIDNSKILVEIHLYSSYPEIASDMWKFLRSVLDTQTFIPVAGESVQYSITDFRKISTDPDASEILPHYVMELECHVWENVHKRNYGVFPFVKSIDTTFEALPYAEVIL